MKSNLPDSFQERVSSWRERLLQLDRRNALIYFKPESRSVLRIEGQTSDEIANLLDSKGAGGASFDYVEARRRRRTPGSSGEASIDAEDADDNASIIPGELRGDCSSVELQRRLGNLRRRQDEWETEQGLQVLYLALGVLHWIDEDGEKAVAPLLLLPAKLRRENLRTEFRLSEVDDDPLRNETLAVKLSEFGIELPEIDQESLSEYFDLVREMVATRTDWTVEDSVHLGIFAYSKLAMWRDLGTLKDGGTENEVVRGLSGLSLPVRQEKNPFVDDLDLPVEDLKGGKLDDLLPIKDQFTVLPADYSQLKAIALAAQGHSLVVHGPPGTGKSQTIANIISTFMATGRTVLFVSEKKAALDVVKKRLDDAGLGTFCLDIHTGRGHKASVYEQLRESVRGPRPVGIRTPQVAMLTKQRQDLNSVARRLHETQQPVGLSVYEVQGQFALLRDISDVDFEIPGIAEIDQMWLVRMRSAVDRIAQREREFLEHNTSHWTVLRTHSPSLSLADDIRRDMTAVESAIGELGQHLSDIAAQLGLANPHCLDGVDRLADIIRHLTHPHRISAVWLSEDRLLRARRLAAEETENQAQRNHAVAELLIQEPLNVAKAALADLESAEATLFSKYERDILAVVDQPMLARYRTDHHSSIKRLFLGSFRQDQRILRSFRKSAENLSINDALELVGQVLNVKALQREWEARAHKLDALLGERFDGRNTNWRAIEDDVTRAEAALNDLEFCEVQRSTELQELFSQLYAGFETEWSQVTNALEWTAKLLALVGDTTVGGRLAELVTDPPGALVQAGCEAEVKAARQRFDDIVRPLAVSYDVNAGPWDSWTAASFDEIRSWAARLRDDADAASAWIIYRAAVAEADVIVPGVIAKCREATDQARDVPDMVTRRVFRVWLDSIYSKTPELRGFTPEDHEALREDFKKLDAQFGVTIQSAIRSKVFRSYGGLAASHGMGILEDQLSRRRRQMPIRRLLAMAAATIQGFKPCFLMSPLTVSQFLPLESDSTNTLLFDAVIFDEASQVFPEDAVPALLHGHRAILAGDPKQLPPTTFWRTSLSGSEDNGGDDDDDYERDSLEDRESILDVAVGFTGRLFRDSYLDIHYRSRHEDLIRFSNGHFYQNRLLTFPSPYSDNEWQGIHDHFLPDGVYDAGRSRTNRREAEEVVDLVFEHVRTYGGGKSLGVAALSKSQADLISRLIDERRLLETDVESAFNEDGKFEPFFVKNLENVQGDERDRIVISVGYGPTVPGGATPNRFGPLNVENGERRLNVLITRARERMDIVHSIRPTDIHSEAAGARLLRRFLEFAHDPDADHLTGPTTTLAAPSGEELNDFETAVKNALEARGHRVVGQIGSAGYRIDLAILSEDGARYDLGVECDGATYHSAPAARDRDWLRQSVLEDLGWTIHRVWSTSWVRDPTAEINRIESALHRAEVRVHPLESVEFEEPASEGDGDSPGDEDKIVSNHISMTQQFLSLAPYVEARLTGFKTVGELRFETSDLLMDMADFIVRNEGPAHQEVVITRFRERYGLSYVNKNTRRHVEWALNRATVEGRIFRDGDFLYKTSDQFAREPRELGARRLDQVPPTELKQIAFEVAKSFLGPKDELIVAIARLLGFARTGPRIKELIGNQIEEMLTEGQFERSLGIIQPRRGSPRYVHALDPPSSLSDLAANYRENK